MRGTCPAIKSILRTAPGVLAQLLCWPVDSLADWNFHRQGASGLPSWTLAGNLHGANCFTVARDFRLQRYHGSVDRACFSGFDRL